MNDNKENLSLQLPPKPERAIMTALKQSVFYAAIFAGVTAIASKMPVLKAIWSKGPKKEVIDGAILGGSIGTIMGLTDGVRKNAEYPLKIENIELKAQAQTLKAQVERLQPYETYAQQAAVEKLAKELEPKTKQ